ncbi:MAG: tRNA uridine-5-carboxymethylaminomethyl(34) synthesis GTPase MnmE [Oligoflexia bacterium]|nr:tRNA uridine-5-carboxymethylaminomethyl(34) synthesis GTPase MnmE [Oligoflexia bacterium]
MPQPHPHGRDRSGYLSEDTIAAITTALGGPIAIVRISGGRAFEALETLCPTAKRSTEARKLQRARLLSREGEELDDALSVRFPGPDSYTGEDVVELHLHGSAFVANRVLENLQGLGVRQALPGEFSFRAVCNGKMSLSQAEAVADLISASNGGAVQLALEKMSGTQNQLLAGIAAGLRRLAVMGELGIDFADQDVEEIALPRLKPQLEPLLDHLTALHASYDRGIRIQEGIRVAFIGLPNSGKSSFFNALLGEDRSIVSEIAGTTRDVIRERLTLRGTTQTVTLRLEDTAGLRASGDQIEKLGIERSERAARDADLLLFLVDVSAPLDPALAEWRRLGAPAAKTLGILTKCDLLENGTPAFPAPDPFGITSWLRTSAKTGAGIADAVQAITERCSRWTRRDRGEVLLTRLDQVQAVAAALGHLQRATSAAELDLFAADLRQALHALAPLIGETPPDDILGQIFSNFCIGK